MRQVRIVTYHAIGEDNSDFLDSATELVLGDAALVLNVEEFERLRQELGFFLRGWTLLRKLCLQILLETTRVDTMVLSMACL